MKNKKRLTSINCTYIKIKIISLWFSSIPCFDLILYSIKKNWKRTYLYKLFYEKGLLSKKNHLMENKNKRKYYPFIFVTFIDTFLSKHVYVKTSLLWLIRNLMDIKRKCHFDFPKHISFLFEWNVTYLMLFLQWNIQSSCHKTFCS